MIDDLKKFMDVEGIREREHAYCKIHGFDHSKCDPSEPCEVHPIDTLEGYRALLTRYAAEQAILQWADRKNVTARESVRHSIKDIMGDASVMNTLSQLHLKELSPESISKWEVQQYYDANPTSYGDKEFSAVEDEIRNILAEKKHEDFLPGYIEGLKKSAGLEVNFDLLRVTEPSENDIRAFYEENIAGYQTPERAEITEIVFDSRETADKAVRMLGSGASFETVGAEYGRDGAPQARIIEGGSGLSEMNAAIWRMAEGETSGVLADTDGSIRMVRLIRKMPPGVRPLTDVRAEITEAISLENMEREYSLRKDEAVFSIHSERYTLGDFYTEFKELSPEYQRALSAFDMKKELLEQFIAKELLLEESDDASKSESELHDMDELRVQYLSQILHKEEVDDKLSEPTDDEARLFYENNKRFFITEPEALISLIAIDAGRNGEKFEQARKKVGEAKEMLDSGVDFAEVAKKYSEDPRAKNGGEISQWLCRNDLSPELWRAIFALKPGEYSGIIETGGGFLIIKLRELTEQKQRTFEESAALIKTMLKSQRHKEMEEDMEKQLLEERGFTIYDKTLRRLLKEQAATL
ncbi:MAG: peptidyl-prolyl cis-trans isomerase [Synergistaceae bacterium]|nr:peptidyl-prolyl cis-trans isomerase [Synergistaceae bacterium]